jgi:hypothetical protein
MKLSMSMFYNIAVSFYVCTFGNISQTVLKMVEEPGDFKTLSLESTTKHK